MSCTEIILLAPTSSGITPSQTGKNAVSLDLFGVLVFDCSTIGAREV
jgi:hypothetical protein